MEYVYPFGSPLQKEEHLDKTPKKVFVLGVYASAVIAKWVGCCISDDDPFCACVNCKADFYKPLIFNSLLN